MKRIARIFAMAAFVCGFAYAFSACQRQEEFEETAKEVVFSAATSYENLPETKTIYSGTDFNVSGNQGTERIDWVGGTDKIKVLNVTSSTAAVYTVGTPTASGVKSEAAVTADAAKLTWTTDGNPNTFYAVYPSTAMNSSNVIGANIPANQSAQSETHPDKNGNTVTNPVMSSYAYMVAKVENATNGSNVTLPFVPAMTAFEFNVAIANDGGVETAISSFEMTSTSTALTGDWTWNGTAFSCPAFSANTNDKITVTFPAGTKVTSSNPLRFTVFALPQNLQNVKLTFNLSEGPKNLTLTGKTFTGGKKYRITTPGLPTDGDWIYEIEEISDTVFVGHTAANPLAYNVKSYRYHQSDPSKTNKVAVPWKTQYSLDGGTTWTDVPSTGIISGSDYTVNNAAITGNGVSSATYATGEPRSAALNGSSTPTGDVEHSPATIIAELASREHKGEGTGGAYDLSMYDINGNSHRQTTANSYVVTAPGTYKFPVVFGNAITDGQTNYAAFWPSESHSPIKSIYNDNSSSDTFRYLPRYRDATNGYIAAPNIIDHYNTWDSVPQLTGMFTLSNLEAVIVWQNRMELTANEASGPIVRSVSYDQTSKYITFTIDENDIRPGNIIIALRGKVGTQLPAGTILWSWQIWVTADDLTPVAVSGGSLMPYNLGYIDSTGAGTLTYPDRIIQFRIVQEENGIQHDTEDFLMEQIGDGRSWDASIGFNVYYQWGRKDPMIPAKDYGATPQPVPDSGTRLVYPDANIYTTTYSGINANGFNVAGGYEGGAQADYGSGIKYPYWAALNTVSTGWVGGNVNGEYHNTSGGTTIYWNSYSTASNREESCIPVNLWNNGLSTTSDGTEDIWKTIYDPCPPGFCVPTLEVFSDFTASNIIGRNDEGAYFNALNGGRIFMPYSGLRVFYNFTTYNTLYAEEVRQSGWYWTNTTYGDVDDLQEVYYSKSFSFGHSSINPTSPYSSAQDYTKGSSMAIRPMVDPKVSTGPAPSQSPSLNRGNGSIQPVGNGGEIPSN